MKSEPDHKRALVLPILAATLFLLAMAVLIVASRGSSGPGIAQSPANPPDLLARNSDRTEHFFQAAVREAPATESVGPTSLYRQGIVALPTHEMLATVNGVAVRAGDLASGDPARAPTVIWKHATYRHRLRRAIDEELIFQAAESRGIGLSEQQQERLEQVGLGSGTGLGELEGLGVTWQSRDDRQDRMERRALEAMMLRQNLVADAAGVGPSPDRERQGKFEEALRELMRNLRAEARIRPGSGP